MAIILRLQGLPWSATASDIRQYFVGLSIPDGGVHIVGGEDGDVFIAFASDEDARQAMRRQKEPLMGVRVMILLSSKSEMQEVIAKSRQAQGRDPFHSDSNASKESSATIDTSSAMKLDASAQSGFDRRDINFASPMSPDPSQGGRPIAADNFQDRSRIPDQEARDRKVVTSYNDPYNQSRTIAPENGSFGHTENRPRDHDRRTPQTSWQRDAREGTSSNFNDPHQPFCRDPPRGADSLLGDVPGHQVVSQSLREPQSDHNWPKNDVRSRHPFKPDNSSENPMDGRSFSHRETEDFGQRHGRPAHPQDPFEGAGRDFIHGKYAEEPGRDIRAPGDFGHSKGVPLAEESRLPHDVAYKRELEESLCVYLQGLPFTIKEHEVVDFFRGLRIARNGIGIVLDPQGRPVGDGFVKFVSKRDTVDALKRHKNYIGNCFVEVIPCSEGEYQTMKKPLSVQSIDRHVPDGHHRRSGEPFRKGDGHGLPSLLGIPTQEPFTPQDRDHRRDMPFGRRDGQDTFHPRNKGPTGPNFHRDQKGTMRDDFNREGIIAEGSRDHFNPNRRGSFESGSRDVLTPGDREGFNPGNREEYFQGNRDRFHPGSREGFHQGNREGFNPGNGEGFTKRDFNSGRREEFNRDRDHFTSNRDTNLRDSFGPLDRRRDERGLGGQLDRGLGGPLDRGLGGPLDNSLGITLGESSHRDPSGNFDIGPGGPLNRGPGGPPNRGPGGPFIRDGPLLRLGGDESLMDAEMPDDMYGASGRPTISGPYSKDRFNHDEFNRNPGEFHNRHQGPFEREPGRNIGHQARAHDGKYEWERDGPSSLQRERGRPPGNVDKQHRRPDMSFNRDRPRTENQFEREFKSGYDAQSDRDRRRTDRQSEKQRGRSDDQVSMDKSRQTHKDKSEPDAQSTSLDLRIKSSENSRDQSRERDRSTSGRESSREKRGSDRIRSKDIKDKSSSGDERTKDRITNRDKNIVNGPYTTRSDHDRERKRSPSKSSRSQRDRSRSPIRSQCVELKGIPPDCQAEDIYQFFKGLSVASEGVFIPYDSKTGKAVGQCYVKFASEKDAQSACKIIGNKIGHNVIEITSILKEIMEVRVKEYKKRLMDGTTESSPKGTTDPEQQTPIEEASKPELIFRVRLENVPYTCSVEEIYQFLPDCQIARRGINFVRHLDGINMGKPNGSVIVEFVNEADISRSLAKNGNTIRGRNVKIVKIYEDVPTQILLQRPNNRDYDDRMSNSSRNVPLLPRFGGSGGPGMRPPGLSSFGKPRLDFLQSGPRQVFGNPHMHGEENNGPAPNIQKLGDNNCVIGITNLPLDVAIPHILKFFQNFSPITNSVRLHFNNAGMPTGDALIAFPTPMLANNAVEDLHGTMLGGRTIGLKMTQPPPGVM
ncbi:uncharacterized protein [Antedon mediterranea]|uniref:uncharacterized protein n=1 Tax=Antedon mediterranea TaxID=105859 RepID=UPI003AF4D469